MIGTLNAANLESLKLQLEREYADYLCEQTLVVSLGLSFAAWVVWRLASDYRAHLAEKSSQRAEKRQIEEISARIEAVKELMREMDGETDEIGAVLTGDRSYEFTGVKQTSKQIAEQIAAASKDRIFNN